MVDGLHMPKPNREYLMFLEYQPQSQTYEIITGYQLKEGEVESLDGVSIFDGEITEKYRNYPKYNGMDVQEFEKLVADSIVAQSKKEYLFTILEALYRASIFCCRFWILFSSLELLK